jgi:hypothetical protein
MRATSKLTAAFLAVGTVVLAARAEAKTCKDIVTANARSSAQVSDTTREKRAHDKAISNWGKRAADTYGWSYRFWYRAEEKTVECGGTEKSKSCKVAAKPCSLF